MSFLEFVLPFLNGGSKTFDHVADAISVAAALGGSSCFLAAFIPQFLWTYRTQNTLGLNKKMFRLHYAVGLLFFFGAFYLFVVGFQSKSWALMTNGIIFAVLNFVSSTGSLYTIMKKGENVKNAASLGISEEEYYEKHLAPSLKK